MLIFVFGEPSALSTFLERILVFRGNFFSFLGKLYGGKGICDYFLIGHYYGNNTSFWDALDFSKYGRVQRKIIRIFHKE